MSDWVERDLTLLELRELLQTEPNLVVEADSPDGFVGVTDFFHHGYRPCVRVLLDNALILEASEDHWVEVLSAAAQFCDGDLNWAEAGNLLSGDVVLTREGPSRVCSVEHVGVKEVFDLSVAHEASEGRHRFYAAEVSTHNCVNCGVCIGENSEIQTVEDPGNVTPVQYVDHSGAA